MPEMTGEEESSRFAKRKAAKASFQFAACSVLAVICASAPVVSLLHGQGLWLFGVAMVIALPTALGVQEKVISVEVTREAHGLAWALIGLGIQFNSRFGLTAAMPFLLRFILLAAMLVLWSWLGRMFYSLVAPEADAERAQP